MIHTRILLLQLFSIMIVLCAYFLGDEPDSLSLMHFNPACPSEFSSAVKSTPNNASLQTSATGQNSSSHKTNIPKYISYEVILPQETIIPFIACYPVRHSFALPHKYSYLFFEEINPPPPKFC